MLGDGQYFITPQYFKTYSLINFELISTLILEYSNIAFKNSFEYSNTVFKYFFEHLNIPFNDINSSELINIIQYIISN